MTSRPSKTILEATLQGRLESCIPPLNTLPKMARHGKRLIKRAAPAAYRWGPLVAGMVILVFIFGLFCLALLNL